ncbi:hypothetical protein PLANPX_4084 [Lacipirellula parvula]|uniref:Uncharacterized protein n=1 Tax=Lacipirellula parvula TaxID=2650471 RepID=A0A5K7XEN3_9BACT|nr:hypothetical protein PLANPX_4084 [Lacipirellula parvula]
MREGELAAVHTRFNAAVVPKPELRAELDEMSIGVVIEAATLTIFGLKSLPLLPTFV